MKKYLALICTVALLMMGLTVVSGAEPDDFVDDCTSTSKASSTAGDWDAFNPHPESGLSVLARQSTATPNQLNYKREGNRITNVTVGVQYYDGFFAAGSTELQIEYRKAASADWNTAAWSLGAAESTNAAAFKKAAVTLTDTLPDDVMEIRVSLANGVAYTLMLDEIKISYAATTLDDTITAPVDHNHFVEPFENWDKVSEKSSAWILQGPHPQTGLKVAGRRHTFDDSTLIYKQDGYKATDFSLDIQYSTEYTDFDKDLVISVRKSGETTWAPVAYDVSNPTDSDSPDFKLSTVTPKAALPDNVAAVKIDLHNDMIWTMFLDTLKITYADTTTPDSVDDTLKPVTTDLGSFDFTDDLKDDKNIKKHSDNYEFITPHPESGENVMGKTNGKIGTVQYAFDGKTISNFALKFQVAPDFFNPTNHLQISVRAKGSDKFDVIAVKAVNYTEYNATFGSLTFIPAEKLPDNIEEIKIAMANDVAWTLFLDDAQFNLVTVAAPSKPSENPSKPTSSTTATTPSTSATNGTQKAPSTGAATAFPAAALLIAVSGAAVLMMRKKK